MIQIVRTAEARIRDEGSISRIVSQNNTPKTALEVRQKVREHNDNTGSTRIELGLTTKCPYGLSAWWGDPYQALSNLSGVASVDPVAHASGSTASVFLEDNSLPNLKLWKH
jgi:hypothetical protein